MSNRTRIPGSPDAHEFIDQRRGADVEPSKMIEFVQEEIRARLEKFTQKFPPKDKLAEGEELKDPMEGNILFGVNPDEAVEKPLKEALIYLVDDDAAVAKSVKRNLGRLFSNFKIFNDGLYAVEAIFNGDQMVEVPHLIVTDTNMPRMGGKELAQKIQAIDEKLRPRMIALTGRMDPENIDTYVRLGIPVFGKPFDSIEDFRNMAIAELRNHPGFRPVEKK